jgi:hypothetical protein
VLRIPLPADTALRVETLGTLGDLNWLPLDAPGNEPRFRSRFTEQEIPLPASDAFQFYRVSLIRP